MCGIAHIKVLASLKMETMFLPSDNWIAVHILVLSEISLIMLCWGCTRALVMVIPL